MDNEKQESLWDSLADELGADAAPDAGERRQPEATELPSAAKSDQSVEPPKPEPSDWGGLAETLGLEVTDEPEPAEELSSAPAVDEPVEEESDQSPEEIQFDELPELTSSSDEEVEDFSFDESGLDDLAETSAAQSDFDSDLESSADDDSEKEETEGISGEAARDAFDALFAEATTDWELPSSSPNMFDTPLEFSRLDDEADSEGETSKADSESESAEEESTEKPKRRRRRRRRGRRGRGEEKTEQTESGELDDSVAESTSEDSTGEDSEADGEEKQERPKRRRRRRGRRGSGRSKEGAEGKSETLDDGDDELGEFADDEASEAVAGNGSGPSRQRASHRNLPTWTEAIGCIVDANLEQRSKAPAKQSSSRGRGRGRGRRKNSNRD